MRVFHTDSDPGTSNCSPDDGNLVFFEVEDTGIGIAEDEIERLFKYFEQTRSGLKTQTGTGLGLAISREYVRLMGGEMGVSSQVGVRTIFRFHLPVQRGRPKDKAIRPEAVNVVGLKSCGREYSLLVAEDESDSRYLLKQMLEKVGYTVREATNGAEALAAIQESRPHLVLMDGAMPVMDGLEATRRIKMSFHNIPVIMVTASALEEDRGKMLAAGADDVIRKPYREYDLLGSIQAQLGVEYVCCEDSAIVGGEISLLSPSVIPEALTALPADLIEEMREATINGYLDRLRYLLENVANYDGQLANGLRVLAERYEYDTLCHLFSREGK
ncbi:MAG: response regulator [Desulfomonile tiedjei]|uniref:histidine kinase n=1 Tax=Desulfomonile tiedjei TaxID=2358 RepID=A0A9D6V3L4_9BACT|nr:response regulator [Desulfomonile tiedjei]